ncbi:LacI family DNA-binding transcriptional regulator [Bifidobacterium bifidum]|jgi:LacI family transcriptional regulator|uniref:LacI family DNA-binding transcriptional regulator n=1 Tax=Bifidobacterium bifidum TaxID=1681 RepID=A0A415C4L0_BIFBI|nr:LacI family DNA-binding transcriptional regulator [Bifidobacterium bifidum]RGJ39312.1 LacI family DNA-binding transcriptional regulator [Bifidobacterium bifidum]RGJ57643.1 LacI family DNA-binding transcriptional regulator [Bifidobacterium bifidum]RGK04769.1 LacI family DNA-binding transcriptional regulator [Bifidobacterium bifidum]RGK11837.1 LacI family DNA-binding transcriptional regulator [Bifidobacterium bifidum]RGK13879.1 LacI family DNA-binding transcriptional regulator [Bifidobacteriu
MAGDMKKPRVSEIAKLAGVSTATVSKVINGREGVSSSTRARIEKIMEESGYSKSLVTTKTSQTIELVLTEVMANGINAIIAETSEYVKSMPIGITITQTGRGKRSEESFREILNRNPLGVILLLSNATEREKTLLRSRNIPFVIIDSIGEGSQDTLGVGIDNWTGGLIATEHLIKLGHQRIGIITGPQNAESAQARYSGYATALRRAGIQLDPELVAYGDYMPERGYECACQLLDLPAAKRPTAIFACNDITALNVYRAARQRGLSLPADLSVVGFDNVYPAQYLYPALTTISQPFDMIARKAVDMILDARAGSVADHYLILPTRLVVRESTTAPKKS